MTGFVDSTAFNYEQGQRARKLFAAVVLAALDDAIADDKKYGNGPDQIARWARSRDGREVLSCAGIDPNERVVKGLMEFVGKGVRTSVALSREESERRHLLELHVEQCRQCQTLLQQIAELQSVELATGPTPLRVRPPVPSEIAG